MADERILGPRPGAVIAETMGDETMVIDTESGVFYSLRGVGSALWALLEPGATVDALVAAAEQRYPEADGVGVAVRTFVARLLEEAVIEPLDSSATPATPSHSAAVGWPDAFTPPTVDAHRDMNDLLLVDPLHDVDDTGWPRRTS